MLDITWVVLSNLHIMLVITQVLQCNVGWSVVRSVHSWIGEVPGGNQQQKKQLIINIYMGQKLQDGKKVL